MLERLYVYDWAMTLYNSFDLLVVQLFTSGQGYTHKVETV